MNKPSAVFHTQRSRIQHSSQARGLSGRGGLSYTQLLSSITEEIRSGLIQAQKALEYARLKTYWNIGCLIHTAAAASNGAIRLGDLLYETISADILSRAGLDLSADTIRRTIQFYKSYPEFPEHSPLTFTHYIALQRVNDPKKRARLERRAMRQGMTAADIKEAVFEMNAQRRGVPAPQGQVLECLRGEPYIYRTCFLKDSNEKEEVCVDCGFKMMIPFSSAIFQNTPSTSNKNCRCMRVVKNRQGYDVRLAARKWNKGYTYAAGMLHIIDGDTFDALVDVGFYMHTRDRFRLKGINTPEMSTPAGRRAKKFLTEYLSQCPRVIIRTTKEGMYGRWLADVFAIPGCDDPCRIAAEGEYLNQVLLDKGLAEVYKK